MRFLCARHVLSLVEMSCFSVLCRKVRKTGGGRGEGGRVKNMYFFSNTLVSQGSLRKKKYIFYNSGDSWGGV